MHAVELSRKSSVQLAMINVEKEKYYRVHKILSHMFQVTTTNLFLIASFYNQNLMFLSNIIHPCQALGNRHNNAKWKKKIMDFPSVYNFILNSRVTSSLFRNNLLAL
jgi:hypothetical protein